MAEQVPLRENLFVEDADGPSLHASKCVSCGQVFFPKVVSDCMNCGHSELEDVRLSRRGELYSFTVAEVPSWNFMPPYTVGYVKLAENVRVFSHLENPDEKPLAVGMEMELFIDKLFEKDGKEVIGYKFRPAG